MKPTPIPLRPAPSPSGRWLAVSALLLLPLDLLLYRLGRDDSFRWVVLGHQAYGYYAPSALDVLRFALPAAFLAVLMLGGRVSRLDLGLTLGEPRRTLRWVLVPAAVSLVGWLVVGGVGLGVVRAAGWQVTAGTTEIGDVRLLWVALWHSCLVAPLVEELLYRSVLVPALEWLGGGVVALLGSGVAFVLLHLFYGRPAWAAPHYFVAAMLLAWSFRRSRSVVPPLVLHAAGNLLVLGKDVVILECPALVQTVLGPAAGP
ncbi:MAG TPA: CPBP family intramembrane glutamic endopeptidase [Gemmataceae bacterium]|nr:CPBP family intramembrane glutamic endopeptidase [Gemmataceae bacterium]